MILAIEASQSRASVAVSRADGAVFSELLRPSARHDDDLMPAIGRLMKAASLSPRDLRVAAVSIGPGGFTGLRIAVTTAKMLAQTLGVKLIAVPSALVAAQSWSGEGPIIVALAAKADRCWVTRLTRRDDQWVIDGRPGLADARRLDLAGIQAVLADEHLPSSMCERCEREGVRVAASMFEAAACLQVARRMMIHGEFADALSLQPLYARQPEAVTLWEQRRRADKGVQ